MKLISLFRNICSRQCQSKLISSHNVKPWNAFHLSRIHSRSSDSELASSTMAAVVKIFTISRSVDGLHPWVSPVSNNSTGSGFIISGRRIITNAHVVKGATYIQAKKHQIGTLYNAKVQAFGHSCDLAILEIDNEDFWKDVQPLEMLNSLPSLSQTVDIVGYPQGGNNLCITRGIVSRIDVSTYSHSKDNTELPTLQVDAAINPGNSGGPVFLGQKVVGVAFQKLYGDNIGYVIPAPIVNIFLRCIELGQKLVGFCSLGLGFQAMENQMMRSYFEMTKKMTGVLVTHINRRSCLREVLRKSDILLEVDGLPIQDDGEVSVGTIGMHINGYIALKKMKEKVSLKVLREGLVKNFSFSVIPHDFSYITDYPAPSYYIFGGFVFTNSGYGTVKISQVLEGDINIGYTSFGNLDVYAVNGTSVSTLEGLCHNIAKATDFVRLDLGWDLVAVINIKSLGESDGRLLKFHKIMHGISKDLEDAFPCLGEKRSD